MELFFCARFLCPCAFERHCAVTNLQRALPIGDSVHRGHGDAAPTDAQQRSSRDAPGVSPRCRIVRRSAERDISVVITAV